MTQLPDTPSQKRPQACVMRVVRVSGTIKKAEEEAIKRARAAILKANRESGEGDVDSLMGLLGKEKEPAVEDAQRTLGVKSDVSDEDGEIAMVSDEDD